MNFLAHASLALDATQIWHGTAEDRQGLLAGAIIGDFVKGRISTSWPQPIQAGVQLHRKIDALSNQNSNVALVSSRYPPELRRYAPIFIDLLADFHLSEHWQKYYDCDIHGFGQEVYAAIAAHQDLLGDHGLRFFKYMVEANLLSSYNQWPTISSGLESVVRRLRPRTNAAPLQADLVKQVSYEILPTCETELLSLYEDLQSALASWNALELTAARQNL